MDLIGITRSHHLHDYCNNDKNIGKKTDRKKDQFPTRLSTTKRFERKEYFQLSIDGNSTIEMLYKAIIEDGVHAADGGHPRYSTDVPEMCIYTELKKTRT